MKTTKQQKKELNDAYKTWVKTLAFNTYTWHGYNCPICLELMELKDIFAHECLMLTSKTNEQNQST